MAQQEYYSHVSKKRRTLPTKVSVCSTEEMDALNLDASLAELDDMYSSKELGEFIPDAPFAASDDDEMVHPGLADEQVVDHMDAAPLGSDYSLTVNEGKL